MKKKLLVALPVVAVAIQFVPVPAKTNPPVVASRKFTAAMQPPAAVQAVFDRACMDCHSNETRWPWYADVAPVSWPVRQHVVEGRKHMNLSEWLKPGETKFSDWNELEKICETVKNGTMPLARYDWMHPEAKLSEGDRMAVCAWVDGAIAGAR